MIKLFTDKKEKKKDSFNILSGSSLHLYYKKTVCSKSHKIQRQFPNHLYALLSFPYNPLLMRDDNKYLIIQLKPKLKAANLGKC